MIIIVNFMRICVFIEILLKIVQVMEYMYTLVYENMIVNVVRSEMFAFLSYCLNRGENSSFSFWINYNCVNRNCKHSTRDSHLHILNLFYTNAWWNFFLWILLKKKWQTNNVIWIDNHICHEQKEEWMNCVHIIMRTCYRLRHFTDKQTKACSLE